MPRAGVELDLAVGKHVMRNLDVAATTLSERKRYSTDPAAALEVADNMRAAGYHVEMATVEDGWFVSMSKMPIFAKEACATLAEAICRAALAAVESGVHRATEAATTNGTL